MGGQTAIMTKRETAARYAEITRLESALLVSNSDPTPTRKRLAAALERALRRVPQILDTERGQSCLALVSEIREDWKGAVGYRRMQVAHMAFMRELAQTESASGRQLMLGDYPPRAFVAVYDQLAVDYMRIGDRKCAMRAQAMSRQWRRKR